MKSRRTHVDLTTALCHWCQTPTGTPDGVGPAWVTLPEAGGARLQCCSLDHATLASEAHQNGACPNCEERGWT